MCYFSILFLVSVSAELQFYASFSFKKEHSYATDQKYFLNQRQEVNSSQNDLIMLYHYKLQEFNYVLMEDGFKQTCKRAINVYFHSNINPLLEISHVILESLILLK